MLVGETTASRPGGGLLEETAPPKRITVKSPSTTTLPRLLAAQIDETTGARTTLKIHGDTLTSSQQEKRGIQDASKKDSVLSYVQALFQGSKKKQTQQAVAGSSPMAALGEQNGSTLTGGRDGGDVVSLYSATKTRQQVEEKLGVDVVLIPSLLPRPRSTVSRTTDNALVVESRIKATSAQHEELGAVGPNHRQHGLRVLVRPKTSTKITTKHHHHHHTYQTPSVHMPEIDVRKPPTAGSKPVLQTRSSLGDTVSIPSFPSIGHSSPSSIHKPPPTPTPTTKPTKPYIHQHTHRHGALARSKSSQTSPAFRFDHGGSIKVGAPPSSSTHLQKVLNAFQQRPHPSTAPDAGVHVLDTFIHNNKPRFDSRIRLKLSTVVWNGGATVREARDGRLVYVVQRKVVGDRHSLFLCDSDGRKVWKVSERIGKVGYNYDFHLRSVGSKKWKLQGTLDRVSPCASTGPASSIYTAAGTPHLPSAQKSNPLSTPSSNIFSDSNGSEERIMNRVGVGVGGVGGVASPTGCVGFSMSAPFARLELRWCGQVWEDESGGAEKQKEKGKKKMGDMLGAKMGCVGVMVGDPLKRMYKFFDGKTGTVLGTFANNSGLASSSCNKSSNHNIKVNDTSSNKEKTYSTDLWDLCIEPQQTIHSNNPPSSSFHQKSHEKVHQNTITSHTHLKTNTDFLAIHPNGIPPSIVTRLLLPTTTPTTRKLLHESTVPKTLPPEMLLAASLVVQLLLNRPGTEFEGFGPALPKGAMSGSLEGEWRDEGWVGRDGVEWEMGKGVGRPVKKWVGEDGGGGFGDVGAQRRGEEKKKQKRAVEKEPKSLEQRRRESISDALAFAGKVTDADGNVIA
ncbi:hypothetical protein HDV05_004150 [Chytridiales sp. JEL 0842]|nr:hypothetical protein HDV05_004150 [Chytridiales sp. JEL 0842]